MGQTDYYCTSFSAQDDWSQGENSFEYTFPSAGRYDVRSVMLNIQTGSGPSRNPGVGAIPNNRTLVATHSFTRFPLLTLKSENCAMFTNAHLLFSAGSTDYRSAGKNMLVFFFFCVRSDHRAIVRHCAR